MRGTENTAALLGRVAMSLLFIHGGWGKLLAPAATQAMLASHHLPMVKYGWMLAVVVELGGGLAILFGLFSRPVGLVLAIWCVATALIAHTTFADRNQEIHFLKNMAMMGGFRRWCLESRRTVVAPRSLAAAVQISGHFRGASLAFGRRGTEIRNPCPSSPPAETLQPPQPFPCRASA
jgi:putative oxidoreductase